MKNGFIIIVVLVIIGLICGLVFTNIPKKRNNLQEFTIEDYYAAQDSILVLEKLLAKSNTICNDYEVKLAEKDSIILSLTDLVNYYKDDALVYRYKIERIRQYNKIVENNSSQSVYFRGWVKRVIED